MSNDSHHTKSEANHPRGYGTDPNLITPIANWERQLSHHERELITDLSDIILPGIDEFPHPSQIGIVDFFDEWLSAPYEDQKQDLNIFRAGLKELEHMSMNTYDLAFLSLNAEQKTSILASALETRDATAGSSTRTFVVRFRCILVGAYFTTNIGFKAIGYHGNQPQSAPRSLSSEDICAINAELRLLGLPLVTTDGGEEGELP